MSFQTFEIGGTFSIDLVVTAILVAGTDLTTIVATAAIQSRAQAVNGMPQSYASIAGVYYADLANGKAGWRFRLAPSSTAGLTAGQYDLEVKLAIGTDVFFTGTEGIEFRNPIVRPT